jgi:hypothetical protein
MASRRLGLLSKLARSPHAPVRRIALTEPASRAWLSPAGRTRALAARRTEPDRLAGELRDAASAAGETRSRVDAIRLARRLRLLAGWEETLAGLIEAPPKEARVSATAASAIADLPGPYPADLLERALVHPDPRVRANAVEAMDALARRHADERPGIDRRLVEHKADNEHRARANALRALARGPGPESAGGDLARMLSDDRPTHRLAGVWLAERLLCGGGVADEAWQEMARRIAGLARHEVDAHIRARAKRCSRRLLAEINRGGTPRRTRPTFPRLVREGAA